ncbi:hypothetical protein ACIGO9_29840 [Nocardia asteroides]|uniref:hypothetical protein n=1 Tax=Nocardia asteroides TaxID=1824 RepID=UPI0037C8865F
MPASVGKDWPVKVGASTTNDDGPEWVAADESGTTGEDLLADDQPVIAHAMVRIDDREAAELVADLRTRANSTQAPEMKFKHFRRGRAAQALADTLAPGGALAGRVSLMVAHKPFVAVAKVIDLLVEERAFAQGIDLYGGRQAPKMAATLFADGPRGLGDQQWSSLLETFVQMARPGVGDRAEDVAAFFEQVDAAQRRCRRRSLDPILLELSRSQPHADELVASISDPEDPFQAVLDPLVALIPEHLRHWYREVGRKPYRLLHDEHIVLTQQLVHTTMSVLAYAQPHPTLARAGKAELALFGTGTSHTHPSIQLADLVAGAGRIVTADFLNGKSSLPAPLTEAVTPLIIWGLMPDRSFWERTQYFP